MNPRTGPTERALAHVLSTEFAIDVVSSEIPDAGQDAHAWRYRVEGGDARYFVKVRTAADAREIAASVPRFLHEAGLAHVVAPLRSRAGALTAPCGGYSLTVYPLIDGQTGMKVGLTEQHWRRFGTFVRRVHTISLPAELAELVATETYRPAELDVLPRIDAAAGTRDDEAAAFWTAHRDEIAALAAQTEALGRELEQRALPFVLCHADLHTNNVLIDRDGELWVIDWDEPTRAPKERDLMFVIGGIRTGFVEPQETEWFLEGNGDATADPLALAYYSHAWAVQDLGSYGEQVYLEPAPDDARRSNAFCFFQRLFDPGAIVELARESP